MTAFLKRIIVAILTYEAIVLLRRKQPFIIAITGSVGKTSTKDAIYAALKQHKTVRKSEKSFNSDIGVALTILGLPNAWNSPLLWFKNVFDGLFIAFFSRSYPEILVLEMGVDRPGDMEALTQFIKPNVVVLTSFPTIPVHVEYFSTPEAVVAEKMKLVEALKSDGLVVYNHDDEVIKTQLETVRQRQIGFSRYMKAQFTAGNDVTVYQDSLPVATSFSLTYCGETLPVRIMGVVGPQHVYAYTAAVAVAHILSIPLPDAIAGLSEAAPPPGRMRVISGIKYSVIIDDTYNASPIAVENALTTLHEITYAKRKIVVLGDLLELGQYSIVAHERVGVRAAAVASIIITIGVRARKIAEAALEAGHPEPAIFQYDDALQAGRELQALLASGDVVLVKGSQGMRLERIVEEIMAEPERASDYLVRQDEAWQGRL